MVFDYSSFLKLYLNRYKFSYSFNYLLIKYWFLVFLKSLSKYLFNLSFVGFVKFCVSYWNLSLGLIANFQWAVSKPYIKICFPRRFVGGCGEGAVFCYRVCCNKYTDRLQGSSSSLTFLVDFWQLIFKHHRRFFLLLVFYIYKHHRILFLYMGFYIYKHHRMLFLWLGSLYF